MRYYDIKAIVSAGKKPVPLTIRSGSFSSVETRPDPFIEPSFEKTEFPRERPQILLVSAVAASGKTTTARALAADTGLPVLDLADHKPVADNTLTGVITNAYPLDRIGDVLEGLRIGSHGIIVDGLDEGRSKTTEQGFEAFLDDLVARSLGSDNTSIVIFGRSQVLVNAWCYLMDKGIDVGLVEFQAFDLTQAKRYVDVKAMPSDGGLLTQYEAARDLIFDRLQGAFSDSGQEKKKFLAFIGYPPVLDAIGTLLNEEKNYHKLRQALEAQPGGGFEVKLLIRITEYLLDREQHEKAMPNFINSLASDVGGEVGEQMMNRLFDHEEQCARVLARSLGKPFEYVLIDDPILNQRYEESIEQWCPDHPFLHESDFRNVVFASLAVTKCALSRCPYYQGLAESYTRARRLSYHFLYFMVELGPSSSISAEFINPILQSASEFLSVSGELIAELSGSDWDEQETEGAETAELSIEVSFPQQKQKRIFEFRGIRNLGDLELGPYLVNFSATLPHKCRLCGPALELIGENEISAREVEFDAEDLTIREINIRAREEEDKRLGLRIVSERAAGQVRSISNSVGKLEIRCEEHSLTYPLAQHVKKLVRVEVDPEMQEKYRRLRRILCEFRSHKRNQLAKFRAKIEHQRVLRGDLGRRVLNAMLSSGILTRDDLLYYLDGEKCDTVLGVSWTQLRGYESSALLEAFLREIKS